MIKKRQYRIWQYALEDITEQDGKFVVDWDIDSPINASENLMYYILYKNIMKKEYIDGEAWKEDEQGNLIKAKTNRLPIITIETGRSRKEEDNEKLKKLLNEGFYTNSTPEGHFVFLDNVLSGSQNKECRQIFVYEKYLQELKEYISLGIEPQKCTISKNLTRNALTTTNVYTVPVDMKNLGICIIPDCEIPVFEDVNIIKPYERTAEEDKLYEELMEWIEEDKKYYKQVKVGKEKVNAEDCEIDIQDKNNRKKETCKTVNQWKEEDRKVIFEELHNPKARLYIEDDDKYIPLYIEEQTDEIGEDEIKDIPITEWSTGLQLVTDKNHKCIENVFDGMGLVSKELGERIEEYLDAPYHITGYQLRLPCIKGFFPTVNFKKYYQDKNIDTITDIWGESHDVGKIDILTTESTFKAKLNVVGKKEDGSEKKDWLFSSIQDYKDRLIKYGYNVIGIANFAKPVEEEFRRATYQLWLALNVQKYDLVALSNVQGDIIHRVLSIYREEEIDWEDIKYIEAFLNLIQKENADTNLAQECADAIKAININKKMVFDRKVIQTIKDVINKKLDDMCMGRFYVKGKYLYVTQDILAFLRYAGAENKKEWQYSGFLDRKQFYCGGKILGENVLARNPIMSCSEIAEAEFVDYDGEDSEYINDIGNIIQMPLGTEPDRLGGCDKDGDELLVLSTDYNIKNIKLEYLQNCNFVVDNEESENHNKNLLYDVIIPGLKEHLESRFPNKEVVTLKDYVIPSLVQVNDEDKATAPSKEWNKENVVDFIITSEDRTGAITDINTTIENIANAEGDLVKYALPNAIMKDLQGKMIDASKSGLFDQVVIPKVIKLKYRQSPRFMYFKDGKDYNKDMLHKSSLDALAITLSNFKNYVNKIMKDDTNFKIRTQKFENIYKYLMNPELDGDIVQETIENLGETYSKFIAKNRDLAILKSRINPYSSDDKYKREREIVNQKFKELYETTRIKAEKICSCPSLLATAAVRMTYINSKYNGQNDNYSFCWVVAPEGILQNIKMHEDKEKVYVVKSKKDGEDTFEWLGEYYKTQIIKGEYPIEFDKQKDMSISEEYLRKEDEVLKDIEDLKVTIMGVEKGKTEKIAESMLGKTYRLFINENGFVGIVDKLGIKENETLKSGYDLRKYIGHDVTIKEIVTAVNAQSVIKAKVYIKG